MSASASLESLAEDLSEIKTYLTTQDSLCQATIKSFLSRYDVLGPATLIRASSSLFKDHELLEALLDNWEGLLEPVTFVKFIYTFCLIGTLAAQSGCHVRTRISRTSSYEGPLVWFVVLWFAFHAI